MKNMSYLRLDLKVCEGCGALWLRSVTSTSVYCRACAARLAEFPAPRGKSRAGRRPRLARITHHTHAAAPAGGAR